MASHLIALLLIALVVGCGGEVAPTTDPTFDTSVFLPLPEAVSGIPQPGVPSVVLAPSSRRREVTPGLGYQLELGHCGLASPLDVDGSLWTPLGGHDGRGRPLREDQRGELINASRVSFVLIDPETALLTTARGGVVLLGRSPGPRAYGLCD